MATIQTEGLTKGYGHDGYAINGLSLTVEADEAFGFLGPSSVGASIKKTSCSIATRPRLLDLRPSAQNYPPDTIHDL